MTIDLYRVGTPSIGEVWGRRWNSNRNSGGLGTGVYAFRTQTAAEENIERSSPGKDLHILMGALDNPVQPATLDATRAMNRLSRMLAVVASEVGSGEATWQSLNERAGVVRVSLSSSFGSSIGLGEGKTLSAVAQEILRHTTELRDEYAFDTERFVRDALDATRVADEGRGGWQDSTSVQPMNELLWPRFDGVAPYPEAGGNDGTYGCVIFKEKVDACVGRETEQAEEISADALNRCFRQ